MVIKKKENKEKLEKRLTEASEKYCKKRLGFKGFDKGFYQGGLWMFNEVCSALTHLCNQNGIHPETRAKIITELEKLMKVED